MLSQIKYSGLTALLAGTALAALSTAAFAGDAPMRAGVSDTSAAATVVEPVSDEPTAGPDQVDEIVVIGTGETRSVSTLVPSNLEMLPPGTSIQKALNILPGVMSQSIDALGVNEQSLSLQVRGFSTTHLGYSLDGMPLGDGA